MKLTWKMFFTTLVMTMMTFSIGGYFLIAVVFQSAFDKERNLALKENEMLRSYVATALPYSSSDGLDSSRRLHLLQSVIAHFSTPFLSIRISDAEDKALAMQGDLNFERNYRGPIPDNTIVYNTWHSHGKAYIQVISSVEQSDGNKLYIETVRDVSSVFSDRHDVFSLYRRLVVAIVLINGIILFFITTWTLLPLKKLAKTAQEITKGNYEERAAVTTNDEVGMLATDFNRMAGRLESKIRELEYTTLRQRDFIGSVAHELKTPLTSIIGYADMLRSKKLTEETKMLAANYIITEGKRMETLSSKLLELFVVQNRSFDIQPVSIQKLLYSLQQTMGLILQREGVAFVVYAEAAILHVEPNLMTSLLVNLIDNARKAALPEPHNHQITVSGQMTAEGKYTIVVEDNGKGIPEQEVSRVTEVFYTVNKARGGGSGFGIGLALCSEIVALFQGIMRIDSRLGQGTRVFIEFAGGAEE
ncbi:two-component sensor histidine kinase [Paenibacillus sp. 598K]|uniref:sensor histidine kinase n=1 Tax=Paenibacillus sp. 598K TaxID=1117987 RepID=UPI000FFA4D9E|nr:HAMP domain-containing sensor histidine kinase [Paenibacillus sp. 598K]GBF76483.1 two-component sensor histidine kinase [Paenibacillus sp. 598K]